MEEINNKITRNNYIKVKLEPFSLESKNVIEAKTNQKYNIYTSILYIFISSIIFVIFLCYINDVDFFVQIKTYNNIINNINNFGELVKQITQQQATINQQRFFDKYQLLSQYQCYDMGTYYVAAALDNNYLPNFIRRGVGDIWRINKAASVDVAAFQFCLYIIDEFNDNNIECGNDYYKKLGISGYLEGQLSDCLLITDKMFANINL